MEEILEHPAGESGTGTTSSGRAGQDSGGAAAEWGQRRQLPEVVVSSRQTIGSTAAFDTHDRSV